MRAYRLRTPGRVRDEKTGGAAVSPSLVRPLPQAAPRAGRAGIVMRSIRELAGDACAGNVSDGIAV